MQLSSSISKTSIRPVVQMYEAKPRAFSKNLIPIVKKEAFWNKKKVITRPKTPYIKPEFKPKEVFEERKLNLKIFSNINLPASKKHDINEKKQKNKKISMKHFYINEDPNEKRKILFKKAAIISVIFTVIALGVGLVLFKDVTFVSKFVLK